jgi:glycerophosphoryl diester phosphodiesterase
MPPENSLPAFSAAIAGGADGVELDLFLTRDEQLVVFHDERLEDLSSGYGQLESHRLDELRSVKLRAYDGSFWDETIPTLSEVLDLIDAWRHSALLDDRQRGRATDFVVNIETKGLGTTRFVAAEVERRLASGWDYRNFQNSSFDMRTLKEMRRLLPQLPIGALFEGPIGRPETPWDVTPDELQFCIGQLGDIHPESINITLPSLRHPSALEIIRQSGSRPIAWTASEVPPERVPAHERKELIRFLAENDIILITDYPAAMKMLEQSYKTL